MTNITNINMEQDCEWLLEGSGADHFLNYDERESLKNQYGKIFQAFERGQANMDELFSAAEGRFRAWFFRSAERLPLIHPNFSVYVSMLLKDAHFRTLFPAEIVDRLAAKHDKRKGIKGTIDGSYWTPTVVSSTL